MSFFDILNDDKPVVVLTHGDLLSRYDRAKVHLYLGELLGIPPTKQIFDIPENHDPATQLEVLNMLRYCLEHADKNFRGKGITSSKALKAYLLKWSIAFVVLGIAIVAAYLSHIMHRHARKHRAPPSITRLDWHSIRHLWLGVDYD